MLRRISLHEWVADFQSRLVQLQDIAQRESYDNLRIWIGGLFIPESFITATRQAIAQSRGWSLEELVMEVDVADTSVSGGFALSGKTLPRRRRFREYSY